MKGFGLFLGAMVLMLVSVLTGVLVGLHSHSIFRGVLVGGIGVVVAFVLAGIGMYRFAFGQD